MERWMVRVRDCEETVFLYYKNILSKILAWRSSESPDSGDVQKEAELIVRNTVKLIQASKRKRDASKAESMEFYETETSGN